MSAYHDTQYLDLVRRVLDHGVRKPNRTGVDTLGVFGHQMIFNLDDGTIPLLTTKMMHVRSIIHEILWYLQGGTNIQYLKDNNVSIWDEWADENGNLGPVYGHQWRNWNTHQRQWISSSEYRDVTVDQIAILVDKLKNNPNDRRLIVSAWNVGELEQMALPPCHYAFQCYVTPDPNGPGELSLMLNQRSCDVGLGVPFNVVQYSILLRMLAEVTGLRPGRFIWNGGDVHVYTNHVDGLREQLERVPLPSPRFEFARRVESIDDFKYDDFKIIDYSSHSKIHLPVAV
jgi:thymidylate synthase